MEIQSPVPVLVGKDDHLRNFPVRDLFAQAGEHVLQLLKADRLLLVLSQEVIENALAFLNGILDPLVLPLQKLNELVLFELATAICIDFVHQILRLLLIDLHLAGLEHLYYLVFRDAAGVVGVELHEDPQVLFLGPALAL